MGNKQFEEELTTLINKYSKENDSNTPDFILAKYIMNALNNFNETINQREKWYGRLNEINDNVVDIPIQKFPPFFNNYTGNPPPFYPSTTEQSEQQSSSCVINDHKHWNSDNHI